MSIEKCREEFEVAYQAACLSRAVARFDPSVLAKDHCDDYLNSLVQSAWWGWQASREALVIDLPKVIGSLMYSSDVYEAIEAAGVKVKS